MSLILDLIIQKFNLTYILHRCAIFYCTLVRLVSSGKEKATSGNMEWSVATRHHSLKFKTAPRPHLIIRRIIWLLSGPPGLKVSLGPNRPTQLGAKNQLDQSIFQNFGANPSNCSCLNEELAWKQLVIWVWGVRY